MAPDNSLEPSRPCGIPAKAIPIRVGGCVVGYRLGRSSGLGFLWALPAQRVTEIESIITDRFGPRGCDTDDAEIFTPVFSHIVLRERMAATRTRHARPADPISVEKVCRGWAARWLPGINSRVLNTAIEAAIERPRKFKADTLANLFDVTAEQRKRLGLKTIGAVGTTKASRAADARARKRERDRLRGEMKRRAERRPTQEERSSGSVAETCRRLGISRQTFYRWERDGTLESRLSGESYSRVAPYKRTSILGDVSVTLDGATGPQAPVGQPAKGGNVVHLAVLRVPVTTFSGIEAATASLREFGRRALSFGEAELLRRGVAR